VQYSKTNLQRQRHMSHTLGVTYLVVMRLNTPGRSMAMNTTVLYLFYCSVL